MVSTTTPKKQAVGSALRKHREGANMSMRDIASKVGVSHVSVRRWEIGEVLPRTEDIASILTVLEVPFPEREAIINLAREPDEGAPWLAVNLPERERQMTALLEMESTAKGITTVAPLLVPGLLQTGSYARAIMVANGPAHEVATRVAVRVGRSDAITRSIDPVPLTAYIGESVLQQEIGGPAVMAEQLRHLAKLSQRKNIDLRVVRLRQGWHPGLEGMFTVTHLESSSVVHLETRTTGLFLNKEHDIRPYEEAVEKVRDVAMSESESVALIKDFAKRLGESTR